MVAECFNYNFWQQQILGSYEISRAKVAGVHVENEIAEIGSLSTPSLITKSAFVDLAPTVAV